LGSRLKQKIDAGQTTDNRRRTLRYGISFHGLRPGELKLNATVAMVDDTIYSDYDNNY